MKIFTNGCFDILHRGHIEYLEASKALGTHLTVGLNSDDSVRQLKGLSRPINNQEDRRYVLLALTCVDEVIIFNEGTPYNLIKSIQPDILTKGGDYVKEDIVGYDIVNQTIVIPFTRGYSTTETVRKINDAT
jgi:rfaE bifunctional protein nucleotidyltransferase chain/domain